MKTIVGDPIELLDRMVEQGEDIYEAAVSIGIQNENELTVQRWLQGDLVLRVQKVYGQDIIKKFAVALSVNSSTLKQRRTMSGFYEKDTRYLFENVGYSHYREAMRLGVVETAIEALRHTSENDLPVWVFKDYIDEQLGIERGVSESIPGRIENIFSRDGMCILEISIGKDDEPTIRKATTVSIKAKE